MQEQPVRSMSQPLRDRLMPLVICCASSAALCGHAGAVSAAESLPPLRVDPALLAPEGSPAAPATRRAETRAETQQPASPAEAAPVGAGAAADVPLERAKPKPSAAEKPADARSAAPASAGSTARPATAAPAAPGAGASAEGGTGSGLAAPAPARRGPPSGRERAQADVIEPQRPAPKRVEPSSPASAPDARSRGADVPLSLRPATGLAPPAQKGDEARPTFVAADKITGQTETELVAEGNVELRRAGSTLKADHLTYWQDTDEAEAVGNVRLTRDGDVMTGPKLRLKIEDNVGYFEQPEYSIRRASRSAAAAPGTTATVSGRAERIDLEGENHYRLSNATFSSCAPGREDWYAQARDMRLDYDREIGEARNGRLVFLGVPLLYSPWLEFSLNDQRKSGLLPPTLGSSNKTGGELTVPWYWNIAPNYDATIAPRLMTRRGLQLNTEFRYLQPAYNGTARVEYLPKDQVLDKRRSAYSIVHNHVFATGFTGLLNVNGVSDDTYFTDLGTRVATTAQTYLLRQGSLSYSSGWWGAAASVLRYQTLQDPVLPAVAVPYDRLPHLGLVANRPEFYGGSAFAFNGEYVDFHHPTFVLGKRTTVYPQLSLPLVTPAFYLTPKVGYHVTRYALDRQAAGIPDGITRKVPIMSVDSGVVFERDTSWGGRNFVQTLEPRVYYLRVPLRDQSQIPVFDTGLADFNFAQIFSENIFVGGDRIADANQITGAVISRIIDPATGEELLRAALGQRWYFRDQTVTIPGVAPRIGRTADVLAALSGQILPKTYLDAGWQYNPRDERTERVSLGGRYQPETGKVLNAGYRFTRNVVRDVDVSGQWPLWGKWYGVGRYNYSLRDKRLVEGIAGLEYDGGCWLGRLVMHRFATATQTTNTAFFVQIELNGFSRIGSNPLDILKRGISGYGRISQPAADPVFGAD